MAIPPADPQVPSSSSSEPPALSGWGAPSSAPFVKPLKSDDPFIKDVYQKWFPGDTTGDVAEHAAQLKNNLFQMLQTTLKECDARTKKEQEIEKEMRGY